MKTHSLSVRPDVRCRVVFAGARLVQVMLSGGDLHAQVPVDRWEVNAWYASLTTYSPKFSFAGALPPVLICCFDAN